MATTVARLQAVLTADTRGFDRGMDASDQKAKGFGSRLGSVAKAGLMAAGAAGVGALVYTLKTGISEWTESQKVAAQTEAVIKSTGGSAHVTAGMVSDLATSLMKKSGIDDEAIASGENLLLTFTNIRNEVGKGNDIFTQGTKAAVDMSVALGEDLKSANIQLGKALNDPIKGITALRRVGVSFTKAQQDQIKAMVDSGHTMKAQKVILAELNKEFGGSAEAAGKTLPGQLKILKESFNNWAGDMVGKVVPVLLRFTEWAREHPGLMKAVAIALGVLTAALVAATAAQVLMNLAVLANPFVALVVALVAAGVAIYVFRDQILGVLQEIAAPFVTFGTTVENDATAVVSTFAALPGKIKAAFLAAWSAVENAITAPFKALRTAALGPLSSIIGAFRDLPGELRGAISSGAQAIVQAITSLAGTIAHTFTDIGDQIKGSVRAAIGSLTGFVDDAFGAARRVGVALKNGIVAGMEGVAGLVGRLAKSAVNAVIAAWNAFKIPSFHIHIPVPGPIPDINFDTPAINFPDIPFLQGGGRIAQTGIAVVHKGETVLPASNGTAVFNLSIGGQRVASIVWDQLRNKAQVFEQQNGRAAFG